MGGVVGVVVVALPAPEAAAGAPSAPCAARRASRPIRVPADDLGGRQSPPGGVSGGGGAGCGGDVKLEAGPRPRGAPHGLAAVGRMDTGAGGAGTGGVHPSAVYMELPLRRKRKQNTSCRAHFLNKRVFHPLGGPPEGGIRPVAPRPPGETGLCAQGPTNASMHALRPELCVGGHCVFLLRFPLPSTLSGLWHESAPPAPRQLRTTPGWGWGSRTGMRRVRSRQGASRRRGLRGGAETEMGGGGDPRCLPPRPRCY